MKTITTLTFSLLMTGGLLAQIGERLSISVQGGHQYDLYLPAQDANLEGVPVDDMRGLYTDQDNFDYNFGLNMGVALSPVFSLYGNYQYGVLSGSNDIGEYYQTDFMQYGLGLRFLFHNLTRRSAGLKKWTFVPYAGLNLTDFTAKRYLLNDQSLISTVEGKQDIAANAGLELAYNLNRNWSILLKTGYNWVNNDGLDGYDYGTGQDQFLRSNLGIRYKFTGKRKAIKLVGGRKVEAPVYNLSDRPVVNDELAQSTGSLEAQQDSLENALGSLKKELSQEVLRRIEKVERQGRMRQATIDSLKARDREIFASAHKAFVYFPIESDRIGAKGKKTVFKFIEALKATNYWQKGEISLEVLGYTDERGPEDYNAELRKRRAAAVAELLRNYIKGNIKIEQKQVSYDFKEDRFLDRRVEIRVRF